MMHHLNSLYMPITEDYFTQSFRETAISVGARMDIVVARHPLTGAVWSHQLDVLCASKQKQAEPSCMVYLY